MRVSGEESVNPRVPCVYGALNLLSQVGTAYAAPTHFYRLKPAQSITSTAGSPFIEPITGQNDGATNSAW